MCGRYTLTHPKNLSERFETSNSVSFEKSYNISPGTINPVVTRNSPNKLELMKWGLVPFWAKDGKIGYKMINARSEDIEKKPSFRKPIRSSRCLVPSDGFYEWKKVNLEGKEEKIPWFIGLKNQKLFAFAGIYDIWKDAEGKEIKTYSIITTSPNKTLKNIHNRMPVVLKEKDGDSWLNSKAPLEKILPLLKPFPDKEMVSYPVSRLVNNPQNDNPNLIKPTK